MPGIGYLHCTLTDHYAPLVSQPVGVFLLKEPPVNKEDAISQGHSSATIRRAKNELVIHSHKDRFTGGWKWYTQEQYQSFDSQKKRAASD